jgi:hypothetical protein
MRKLAGAGRGTPNLPDYAVLAAVEPQLFVADIKASCDFFPGKLGFSSPPTAQSRRHTLPACASNSGTGNRCHLPALAAARFLRRTSMGPPGCK